MTSRHGAGCKNLDIKPRTEYAFSEAIRLRWAMNEIDRRSILPFPAAASVKL
jgi:hypothetical protein